MQNYLIDTSEPFRGHTQSVLYIDAEGVERVAYTGNFKVTQGGKVLQEASPDLTLPEYEALRGKVFKRVSEAELDIMLNAHYETLITKPTPITEDQYDYWLEVLPPCRWQNIAGASVFHVSERLTANIVQWCIKIGNKYYSFHDRDNLKIEELRTIIGSISNAK